MQSNKRYTNQTFTKRVDHEGGERREFRAPCEPAVCQRCGIVFEGQRWHTTGALSAHKTFDQRLPKITTVCPACRQIAGGIAGGYLAVDGIFPQLHHDEIVNLLHNEAKRAAEDNALSRIMKWDEEKDGAIKIETTTEHLAQRLGRALEKAYDGKVSYDFSHENKVARVHWHRDH